MAEILFFCAFGLIFYAYLGYWLILRLVSRERPVQTNFEARTVSVVIAARNEARSLEEKLLNLRQLDYPPELVQVIVVSDGSTDETAALLQRHPSVYSILLPKSGGKALALNEGVASATGEFLFFTDVRQRLDPDALSMLVATLSDPQVGAVSGELILEREDGLPSGEALGIYWKIEKAVRRLESRSGSVVGVTGAIYLMRRELYVPLPNGLILDDVLVPMNVVRQGMRVLFQPAANARDRLFEQPGKEFRRKVRTLTGNLQLLQLAPWLLSPRNPLLVRFVSHKLLRLAVPFLMVLMLLSSAVSRWPSMRLFLYVQLVFFGLASLGALFSPLRRWRIVSIPYTFVLLNVAAALAFYKILMRQDVWN